MRTWRGILREEIPWYPTIDPDRCTGCRTCVDFCRNDVLEFDEPAEGPTSASTSPRPQDRSAWSGIGTT